MIDVPATAQVTDAPLHIPFSTQLQPFPRERFLEFIRVLKVQTKDFGLVPFRLLGTQTYVLDEMCKAFAEGISTFVILKARQQGMSTFFLALDLFWAFEYKGLLGAFATHEEKSRDDFRAAIEVFFAELPKTHRVKYVRHNRTLLILRNGSRFRYLVAGTRESNKSALGRSGATNYLHATEVAFYGSEDDLKSLKATLSTHYQHRFVVYETTANGFNHFYDMWETAKSSPSQRAIFVGWWRNELYAYPRDHPYFAMYMPKGVDEVLSPLERKRIRAVREEYGIELTKEQVSWYRWKLNDEFDGDQSMMDQEFPWTEDDAFVATGSKFFTVESITDATRAAKKIPFMPYRYKLTTRWDETRVVGVKDPRAELRIFQEASNFGYYVIGCDPAYGSSDEADRTVMSIFRCYSDRMVQVAEYASNDPSTYQCAWILAHLAGYYGRSDCMVMLEITGPGQAVFQELGMLRQYTASLANTEANTGIRNCLSHMRHYLYKKIDTLSGDLAFQWKTSHDLKLRMMNSFKDAFELGRVHLSSVPCLEEMRRIINDEGSIESEGRAKDDRVIAAALAYQAYQTWVQPKMKAMGMTVEKGAKIEHDGGEKPINRVILDYLKRQQITVP
jgi:hypothetical protein